MQSDHAYQLPVSNITYHVYSPEDERAKTISRQAFQRTMDTYHENEHLADLFQVELDKRERLAQERKDREKSLKVQNKKSSKRSQQGRSQDRSQPQLPERHSLRRHLRNSSANTSSNGTGERGRDTASADASLGDRSFGSMKRSRRISDISNSDISGYGDDDMRLPGPEPTSTHLQSSSSSRHGGLAIHLAQSNERSLSSSPALPFTPSPRLTPSDPRNQNQTGGESGTDLSKQSPNEPGLNSSASSLASSFVTASAISLPGQMIAGRRKRKQAIPVHPSVVERIPGITLRIQREKHGDQLQVEILKNLDDYKTQPDGDSGANLELQQTQDIRKVQESIESGRPGYAFFPVPSSGSDLQRLGSPDIPESSANHGYGSPVILPWNQSLSSSLASLTWASSNAVSVESLVTMNDLIDARSLPLSWENFSTRECVVNKVVGKHDKDLNILEGVVHEAIARQQHTLQQQQQLHQLNQERDREYSPASSHTQRRISGVSNGFSNAAAISAGTASHRTSKPMDASSSATNRSLPTRATRSRAHGSERTSHGGGSNLVAHEDIELVLKQRRKRKMEERRRLGSKASSREDEDEDDERRTPLEDEDDEEDEGKRQIFGRDRKREAGRKIHRDKTQKPRPTAASTKALARAKVAPARYRHEPAGSWDEDSSSGEEREDHRDTTYGKSIRRKQTMSEPKVAEQIHISAQTTATTTPSMVSKTKKSVEEKSVPVNHMRTNPNTPVSVAVLSSDGIRRNKKVWSRGKNTRKEDEVIDTTSDDSGSGDEGMDGDSKMTLDKFESRSTSLEALNTNRRISVAATIPVTKASHHTTKAGVTNPSASSTNASTSSSLPSARAGPQGSTSDMNEDGKFSSGNNAPHQESGGRTRARARSFSSTIVTTDKTNFFESALDYISQKRRETLAKKRAARADAEEKERLEQEQLEQREKEEEGRQEAIARLEQQGKAQKIEASNLPKSSKSLPGRVLRRSKVDGSAVEDSVDPDCTSCRLELSAEDKAMWKAAQETGEIRLPRTWGTHAILCATCKQQYLDHHSRCTACFYVPVREEMAASGASCSRCKAGTWLMEAVRDPPIAAVVAERKNNRHKNISDVSM
ncbi:hypothetical protein BGZ54_006652 [Gamsiella multidivaricata]|nr:hypothetical protein BGZ54_006652 [Gamsiella multidivaricata]